MPYDLDQARDRARAAAHLLHLFPQGRVPAQVLERFVRVYDAVYGRTGDTGAAIVAGKAAAKQQKLVTEGVVRSAAIVAACMTPPMLKDLEAAARTCGCGRGHDDFANALREAHSRTARSDTGERRKGQAKADIEWAWKTAAKEIYRSADPLIIAVRELWQNSRDAGAKHLDITWRTNDEDSSTGTLTFVDDGSGMDDELFENVFMYLGMSRKPDGALGGFGAAKAAILAGGNSWDWEIRSRNWVARSEAFGSYELTMLPQQDMRGVTTILRSLPAHDISSTLGSGPPMDRLRQFIQASDLRNITVTLNGEQIEGAFKGLRAKTEEAFEAENWGKGIKVQVKSYTRTDGQGSIYVRLGGILQFVYERPAGLEYKRDYVIDMDITDKTIVPKGEDHRYPFTTGRDAFEHGRDAYYAYRKMRDALDVKGGNKDKDLGPYETVAPGASDPREVKAQQKFEETLGEVMGSEEFVKVFSELGEETRKFYDGAYGALPVDGVSIKRADSDESPLQGRGGGGPELGEGVPLKPPANPYAFLQVIEHADTNEMLNALYGWIVGVTGEGYSLRRAKEALEGGYASVHDVEKVLESAKEALKQNSESSSDLATAAAIKRVGDRLVELVGYDKAEAKKSLAELNPFGGSAIIKFSNERYNTVKADGSLDQTRSKAFRRSGAKKYINHLVLWEFACRQVLAAMEASGREVNDMHGLKVAGLGFVLDDEANGLTSVENSNQIYVMVNPEILDGVIKGNKERPWVIANFVHGLACHELAHAARMAKNVWNPDNGHNEKWSVVREDAAKGTSWLLPVIAAAARKLFRGVYKWTGRGRSSAGDGKANEAHKAQVSELESNLAKAQEEVGYYRDNYNWVTEQAIDARNREAEASQSAHAWKDEADKLKAASASSAETIARLEALLAEAEQPRHFFRERATAAVHRLESLGHLQDFRDWLRSNPEAAEPLGISVDQMLEVLSRPGNMLRVLELSGMESLEELMSA